MTRDRAGASVIRNDVNIKSKCVTLHGKEIVDNGVGQDVLGIELCAATTSMPDRPSHPEGTRGRVCIIACACVCAPCVWWRGSPSIVEGLHWEATGKTAAQPIAPVEIVRGLHLGPVLDRVKRPPQRVLARVAVLEERIRDITAHLSF
eukprot:COSAG01_NODE_9296_length_2491_cov_9.354933_2_plen_148_part_00